MNIKCARTHRTALGAVLILAGATLGTGATSAASTDSREGGDGPSFIYITPTPIGVNRFLELGEIGTEAAAERLGGTFQVFE